MSTTVSTARRESGAALATVLIVSVVLMAMISAYMVLSISEARTTRASTNSVQGFYSAEGGLNMRAEQVRALFQGYTRPVGQSPKTATPCLNGDTGSGDFACTSYVLNNRTVVTYMQDITKYDKDGNPETGVVEPGDTYTGLNFQQYAYNIVSVALNSSGATEANLKMVFQSRLVPLFQFAVFYNRDLEFHPGPKMTLNGRVHTNGNLYLNATDTLNITGLTDAAGSVNRFGKDNRGCSGTVTMSGTALGCNGMSAIPQNQLPAGVKSQQQQLSVPSMNDLNPDPSGASNNELWNKADVRIVAKKTGSKYALVNGAYVIVPVFTLVVENKDGSTDGGATSALAACNAAVPPAVQVRPSSIWDNRENQYDTVVDIDQKAMMSCIQNTGNFKDPDGKKLTAGDTTGGGMVWHVSFDDGDSRTNGTTPFPTNYAVEVHNAATLGTNSGSPDVAGLTVVTNQQLFVQGDYNVNNKKPASLLADAINVISNANPNDIKLNPGPNPATDTTINAAFISGIDDTVPGQYNGGLQNYPRFHEDWGSATMNYNGSFVSLGTSTHTRGRQSAARYTAPTRNWNYETDFNKVAKLPPLSPRFVYLRQLLFERDF